VGDSIIGWADAVNALVAAYMRNKPYPEFEFGDIRPKGTPLKTAGGKAPGAEPLRRALINADGVMRNAISERGEGCKLKPIEAHDIACFIAEAVISGGIRRSAMISLFDMDDADMLSAKSGAWWETNGQRAMANNSAVIVRHKVKEEEFKALWKRIEASGAGEPGIFFVNDKDTLTNPCGEISLKSMQFCNLTEINASNIADQADFNKRCRVAALLGTLQAAYTDFHYLRDTWKKNSERDALLGVSMTGIASGAVLKLDMAEGARCAVEENKRVAEILGVNEASRVTTVKPSGTTSLVCGTSSGIHAWHDNYYIRRVRVAKTEALYSFITKNHPEIIEDDVVRPHDTAVISLPMKAPEGAIIRSESPLDLLERVKRVHSEWIMPGHIKGDNTHNVSVTVSIKPDEWGEIGQWMWDNRDSYNGISVLNYDGGTYEQTPFESITKEKYEEMLEFVHGIDITKVIEDYDNTDHSGESACAGGACTVTSV
jgi:ribonucleoside-diphosphate reductase alpha chain